MKKICLLVSLLYLLSFATLAQSSQKEDPRVAKVYENSQNQLIWIKNGQWSTCAKVMMQALSQADQEGLWVSDFEPMLQTLKKLDTQDPQEQRQADQVLTLATLNYISDMKGERIKPREADHNLRIKQVVFDEVQFLTNAFKRMDQCAWAQELAPQTHEYKHLKEALAHYRQKQVNGGWPVLPKGTKLELGDSGPLVSILRQQLVAQDSLPPLETRGDTFDAALDTAVRHYQETHGLTVDGVVGPETLAALNTPVEARIQAIIVSMEVLRWLADPLPNRYLIVNVPGFYLKAVANGETAFFIPIITGKEYNKTPIFNTTMTLVTFNPSWYVPKSIEGEIIPKMNRNPGAYARKGYFWSNGRLIQGPGNANALGKIKFYLKNSYGVYLHGTPAMGLFKRAKRALSHGCMRVEDPYKLAEFVLNDPNKWTLSEVRANASGTRTKKVDVAPPLQTFVTYLTVFEGENQELHFVRDLYGIEKEIWKDLKSLKKEN